MTRPHLEQGIAMRTPRLLITLNDGDREILNAVRGRIPLATFILDLAMKQAEWLANRNKKQHQPGHDSRQNSGFTETRLDYSNSQE